ncbi:UPF0598 protein C8orf82 [Aphelenchoides besseyi]|nr:UPF0598 protein C8orf82 [Aphelenchoides besseyi]KAI6207986.1 UPF0598 protein C8orf82 [Aphelenchoides besseyi]
MAWKDYTVKSMLHYKQGQYSKNVREYFYRWLFMDNAKMFNFTSCFKDVKFLNFFFSRLKVNTTGYYQTEFPYISPCGPEHNYVRCDDRPIVFTALNDKTNRWQSNFCSRGYDFQPEKLCMFENGRLYHPSLFDYGLVRSQLADELYPNFVFDSNGNPTHFNWHGKQYELTNELLKFDKK